MQTHKEVINYLTNNDELFRSASKYLVRVDNFRGFERGISEEKWTSLDRTRAD